jgi:hypothetical protein
LEQAHDRSKLGALSPTLEQEVHDPGEGPAHDDAD